MSPTLILTRDQDRIRELHARFFGRLFRDVALRTGFAGVGKVVEMRYTDPDICFYLDLRGEPAFVDATGTAGQPSDIQIAMAWETAHEFWKDDLDVIMAFISQRIKATGETEALLHLRPHFKNASSLYGEISREMAIEGPKD